jgi:UDP-N-acetylmuramate dehydrogenase
VAGGPRAKYPEIPLIEVGEGYKIPAAWLIEHVAESKGLRTGDIGTWSVQPLVIVNYGVASAREIIDFSGVIIEKIKEATGIELEREVNFVE